MNSILLLVLVALPQGSTTSGVQSLQLAPVVPLSDGQFGEDVETQGSLLFVGHPGSATQPAPGKVIVYEPQAGEWTPIQTLSPNGGSQVSDRFGRRLAVDRSFLVVGAPRDTEAGVDPITSVPRGAAFVFLREPSGWTLEEKILPPPGVQLFKFGQDVDVDGDTLVVGADSIGNDDQAPSGRAFVYRRESGQWTLEAELTPQPVPNALVICYGEAVAVSGDRVLVGASETTDPAFPSPLGAVYPFTRTGGTWVEGTTLTLPPPVFSTSHFGYGLDMDGRYAVVGAYNYQLDLRGAAFGYKIDEFGEWTYTGEIGANLTEPSDRFGYSVSLAGQEVVIGSPGRSVDGVSDVGAAHFFKLENGSWSFVDSWTPPGGVSGDEFGTSVGHDVHSAGGAPKTGPAGTGSAHVTTPQ